MKLNKEAKKEATQAAIFALTALSLAAFYAFTVIWLIDLVDRTFHNGTLTSVTALVGVITGIVSGVWVLVYLMEKPFTEEEKERKNNGKCKG